LGSLLAYGISLVIFHHVYPIAAKAYDDLCSNEGMTFGEPYSVSELGIAIVIFAVPLFLGHRDALIAANLIISLVTILGASSLLYTTGDTPYECFTSMGTYEDHTSGLDGFGFWLVIAAFFSYVFLLIDLAIWSVKRLVGFWTNA